MIAHATLLSIRQVAFLMKKHTTSVYWYTHFRIEGFPPSRYIKGALYINQVAFWRWLYKYRALRIPRPAKKLVVKGA